MERGQVRREVLEVAEPGIAAFIAGDMEGIRSHFASEFAEPLIERMEENAEAGKVRVRVHEDVQMDVVDMNDSGTQAIIEYNFTDKSYFESEDGDRLTEPKTKDTVFQLTMDKTDDGWQITRVIGAMDLLQ